MACSVCYAPVIKPSRIPACRHVLCGLCAEKTIQYFRECPICSRWAARHPNPKMATRGPATTCACFSTARLLLSFAPFLTDEVSG